MENELPQTFDDFKRAGMDDKAAKEFAEATGLVTEAKHSLAGARFLVRNAKGGIVGICATDENGDFGLTGLKPGTYTVIQLSAADGYIIDRTPKTFTVNNNNKFALIHYSSTPYKRTFLRQVSSGIPRTNNIKK